MPLVPPFAATRSLGPHLVTSGPWHEPHFERLHAGAWRDDDGEVVPVVVHIGPGGFDGLDADSRAALDDEGAFLDERRRVRVLLDGAGVPRVHARIVADGTGAAPRGTTLGYVEEWAGDVVVDELIDASRAAGGSLPIGVCLAFARAFATPFAALERIAPTRRIGLDSKGVFIDVDGTIRCLVDPYPGWAQMAAGAAVGTLRVRARHMAPEEIRGAPTTTQRAMFGLGVLLFELVAGEYPFQAQSQQGALALLKAIRGEPVPSLAARHRDAPAPVVQLVARLTAHRPTDRFTWWSDVLAAIDGAALRCERATREDVAAVVRGLLPVVVDRAVARREQLAMLDLAGLSQTLPRSVGHAIASVREPQDGLAAFPPDDLAVMPTSEPLSTAWDDLTPADAVAPYLGRDGRGMWHVDDALRIDQTPVTQDAWAAFCLESQRAPPAAWADVTPPPEQAELPVTGVSFADAASYAAHYGKDLPTDDEWQRAVDVLGVARLGIGAVWEWTSTRQLDGWIVRGGRFRDDAEKPSDGRTASWQGRPAEDVGFRCVVRLDRPREG